MSNPLSIIFCGTPEFAVPSLTALIDDPAFDVKLVITQPDRPVGRKQVLTSPPVKTAAESHGIEVIQPEKLNDVLPALIQQRPDLEPDFLVVVAYGQILSREVLNLPRIAPVNIHGSVLPRWRGASPIEHAILNGDTETGVTIQVMEEELDAGPILSTCTLPLESTDTALLIREQLSAMGAALLCETLRQPLHPTPQPIKGVTYCRKLKREDGNANPRIMTAEEIDRMVRALVPWPGVKIDTEKEELKLLETSLTPASDSTPLTCKDDTILHLVTVQRAGGVPMTGAAWARR